MVSRTDYPFPQNTYDGHKRAIKPSDALRWAAEYINNQMVQGHERHCDKDDRSGCCDALNMIRYDRKLQGDHAQVDIDRVSTRSHALLRSIFYKDTPTGYWFGAELGRKHQEHRIIALLMCADMAESIGE